MENSGADDLNIRDVGAGSAAAVSYRAGLSRPGWLRKNGGVICRTRRNKRWEREGAVRVNRKIIAAIILQNDPRAGFGEAGNRASDLDRSGGTSNLNVPDVAVGSSS